MNAVGKIVSLDKTGKPIEDRQELKFMDYWETDPEYKKENISIFLVINFQKITQKIVKKSMGRSHQTQSSPIQVVSLLSRNTWVSAL